MSDAFVPPPNKPRGFAAMSAEVRLEIAKKGGKSVPAKKRSFAANRQLAVEAGRKGGRKTRADREQG